jgi:hypothetical protein
LGKFAKIISFLLHPLLMPSYGMLIFLRMDVFIPPDGKWRLFFVVFFFTFLLPVLNILFLYNRKVIKSIYLETREERNLPFLSTTVVYFITWFMLKDMLPSKAISMLLLSATISVALTYILNRKIKVSAHMTGIGGLTGAVLIFSWLFGINSTGILVVLFLTGGVLASIRMYLGAHDFKEVSLGYFSGLLSQVVLFGSF